LLTEDEGTIANLPALVVGAQNTRGVALLLHGLGGSKEVQRAEAKLLARRGFVGVVIDAVGHGARRYVDFEERFSSSRGERSYFETVAASARELPDVVDALRRRFALPVGACGISMGGATLFGALAQGLKLEAAVSIVASPRWRVVEERPDQRLEAFGATPLLMMTAGRDDVVSSDEAQRFYDAVRPRFGPGRLELRSFPREGHLFTPEAWREATKAMADWFETFLL